MNSSIQLKPDMRTARWIMVRWLCAPSRLMALEQGHTVITGTSTSSRKDWPFSSSSPVKRHSYEMMLLMPDEGAGLCTK